MSEALNLPAPTICDMNCFYPPGHDGPHQFATPVVRPSVCPTCGSDDRDLALGPECLFDGEYDRWHDDD